MLDKILYNTVLCQTFSPCGKYLVAGNIYGQVAVFDLDRILNPIVELLTTDYNKPKQIYNMESGKQICSLASTENFLIIGTVNEITGWDWKVVVSGKWSKPSWTITIPMKSSMEQSDVNSLWLSEDQTKLFAGCGDNNVYAFNLEDGRLVMTYEGHSDYIHSIHGKAQQLISAGEDGLVLLWDERTGKSHNRLEPHANSKLSRPELGKWVGAVSLGDDWIFLVNHYQNASHNDSNELKHGKPTMFYYGVPLPNFPLQLPDHINGVASIPHGSHHQNRILVTTGPTLKHIHSNRERIFQILRSDVKKLDRLALYHVRSLDAAVTYDLPDRGIHGAFHDDCVVEEVIVCGGGPRLALYHVRSLDAAVTYDLPDRGIHVAFFHEDCVVAGGAARHLYRLSYSGQVRAQLPVSATAVYSAVAGPVLAIAGSSPQIDLCTTPNYTDQVLHFR